jgi:exosortase
LIALGAVLLLILWAGLINQLRVEWSINPQYNYGWGVPLLGLYLLVKRWPDRPDPEAPRTGPGLLAAGAGLLLLLLPIRLFQEANPDWRLVSWAYAAVVVSLTLLGLWLSGGRPWFRHFCVPVLFLLVAVPWPTPTEGFMVQSLMRAVAALTVEGLNWCGLAARQQGNLIELPTGLVGINEACSGVRSFQSTLMIAIFLGELYRFSAIRRLFLVGAGVVLAFGLNVARAFFLTWQCANRGPSAIDAWHDPAGLAVFGLAFAGLIGLTMWLRTTPDVRPAPETAAADPNPIPATLLVAAGLWVVCVELVTETWYRTHERAAARSVGWTVAWPEDDPQFAFQPIPQEVRRILRYNDGQAAHWQPPGGGRWSLFLFQWKPGRAAAQLARNHSPEVCLPAAGIQMVGRLGIQSLTVGGLTMPFQTYAFESRGKPLFVFFCLWEDRVVPDTPEPGSEDWTAASRVKAVIEGRRHLGQKVLEVAVSGPATADQAWKDLEMHLRRMIRISREST